MTLSPTTPLRTADRLRSAFTLAEVLAALALMAIVIPVAVAGIRVASRAGEVGLRKAEAARIADRVLGELEGTSQLYNGTQNGVVNEGNKQYAWNLQSKLWSEANLNLETVSVSFEVQGQQYEVRLATLIDPNTITNITQSATATQ